MGVSPYDEPPRGCCDIALPVDPARRWSDSARPGRVSPPSTDGHHQLHRIWAEVLGHGDFGIHDDFFLVGGHSLAGVRVLARLEQVCRRPLPLSLLLAHPTIDALAEQLGPLPRVSSSPEAAVAPWSPAAPSLQAFPPSPGGAVAALPIPAGASLHRASHAQERLWFLHQLDPGLTAYHLPALWRLQGELDGRALERAFQRLIERHGSLRTSFRLRDGEVLQLVHPPQPLELHPEALGDRTVEDVLASWLNEEDCTPFDLASGRLLRARLLQVHPQEHLLLINQHHIASDGWSCWVLARDLGALYNAERRACPAPLPPLPLTYPDYAEQERQRLSGDRQQQLIHHWREALSGLQPLEWPGDHPRPPIPSHRGGRVPLALAAADLVALERLTRAEGATVQMGLLAVLALLLHRHSRQDDLAIGIPIWGRSHPDLEPLIGFFVNTLPIRVRFDPGASFRDLLRQVRDRALAAYAHQDLPFERMVEAMQPERDRSRHPLVQVMVQLLEIPDSTPAALDGLAVESLAVPLDRSRFDLEVRLRRTPAGGLAGELIHALDLFEPSRIEGLARQWITLLRAVLQAPEAPAAGLTMLPPEDRAGILAWESGPALLGAECGLVERFSQQVARSPEAPALVCGDRCLSYGELDRRANQLAHHLITAGVGGERIVPVCLERSLELVVALLAILKAGGAYLPLDPQWPAARQRQLLAAVGEHHPVLTPALLADPALSRQPTTAPPLPAGGSRSLALLCFTSGSTGIPKAVAVEQRGILRLLDPRAPWRMGPGDRLLQLAAVAFDATSFEVWVPLLSGATLVVGPPQLPSLSELARLLRHCRIQVLWLTAGLFHAMVEAEPQALAAVRTVVAGGEVLQPQAVRRLLVAMPEGHQLINGYGPTEGTTFTTAHRLAGGCGDAALDALPIGRPLAGTRVRVLDGNGLLCPIGVVGELLIGGEGLARGYWQDAERTALSFVTDSVGEERGERWYRSGDLVSWNADGTLAFHGRVDGQIKLRGVRIEPGEIEAVLAGHPAVSQVAVVLRGEGGESSRLVAYWVPAAAPARDGSAELRGYVSERLPSVMVPSAFVALAELPLTANGKLDRRALPAPWTAPETVAPTPPDGDLEPRLWELWEQVLGHSVFGVHDHFFQVGGHSLAAARLAVAVEAALGRPLPVAEVFRHPTIREQAGWLKGERPRSPGSHLVVLQPLGQRPPLHVLHGRGGDLGVYLDLARALGPHRPVLGLQAGPGAQNGAMPEPVTVLAARYAEEILARHRGGPIHLLGYSAGGWYAYAVAAALVERGAPVGLLAVLDTQTNARIHRRLGLVLFGRMLLPRLGPALADLALPPGGERRRRLMLQRFRSLNRSLYGTLHLRLPGPERLAAALAGRPLPAATEDPFVEILRQGYRPPRLPLAVDLFAPPANIAPLERLWSFYGRNGVRSHPLFSDHFDFFRPELMPGLAQALEHALEPLERTA